MAKTLRIDGQRGIVAIYDSSASVTVLDTPEDHRDVVHFHTNLSYLKLRETITVASVSFDAVVHDSISWNSGGCCCWVMLEARYGSGVMDEVVRRFRDEYMTPRNKRGYYKLAEVLVPLMRRYKVFQKLIEWTFAYPAVKYGEWYYGRNKWGWVFTPLKYFWLGLFEILGQDTEFIRENGEVV
jgi:hypothetical protein